MAAVSYPRLRHVETECGERVKTMTGHPPITEAMVAALRRAHVDPHAPATAPVSWGHIEGWGAVLVLHQGGRHDEAGDLARLLRWCCSQRVDGRIPGHWEIRHAPQPP